MLWMLETSAACGRAETQQQPPAFGGGFWLTPFLLSAPPEPKPSPKSGRFWRRQYAIRVVDLLARGVGGDSVWRPRRYVVKAKACDIVIYVWVALSILYLVAQIVRAL